MSQEALWFIKRELEYLWSEFAEAEEKSRTKDPNIPSRGMEDIMERIKDATKIIGPITWERIPTCFIATGKYEHWVKYFGVEADVPTKEEFEEFQEITQAWYKNMTSRNPEDHR